MNSTFIYFFQLLYLFFFFADYLNVQIRNQTARMLRAAARSAAWVAAISIVIYNICPIFKAITVHSFPEEEEKPTGKQMERQLEVLPSEGRLGGRKRKKKNRLRMKVSPRITKEARMSELPRQHSVSLLCYIILAYKGSN